MSSPKINRDLDAYVDESTGQVYTRVTNFINRFFPAFDALLQSERVGERDGRDPADIRLEWEAKGKVARDAGTEFGLDIRTLLEMWWSTGDEIWIADHPLLVAKLPPPDFAIFEYVVWQEPLALAGSIDLLVRYGNRLLIVDFKTINQSISTAFFNPHREFMLAPFEELASTKQNKYAMQVQAYRHLLGDVGVTVDCAIYYWRPVVKRANAERARWSPCEGRDLGAEAIQYHQNQITHQK